MRSIVVVKVEEIQEMLRRDIAASSQAVVARKIGVSAPYLYEMVRGTRKISDSVARFYGLEKQAVFVKAS